MPKPPKPCVFCERYGNQSKEHVLARWLEEIFPRKAQDTHTFGVFDDVRAYKPVENSGIRVTNRQGRAHTLKARVVFEHCNGGWLGDNQVATKPLLRALILGQFLDLRTEGQAALSFWAVRAAMVAEFLEDPIVRNILQEHRSSLMANLAPPPGWFVWIGGYGGRLPLEGHELISGEAGTLTHSFQGAPSTPFFMHGLTIGLGRLIIYAVGTDLPEQNFSIKNDVLLRIWPPPAETVLWPPTLLIDHEQEALISRGLLQTFPVTVPPSWMFK